MGKMKSEANFHPTYGIMWKFNAWRRANQTNEQTYQSNKWTNVPIKQMNKRTLWRAEMVWKEADFFFFLAPPASAVGRCI